jgi:hypothetical protein
MREKERSREKQRKGETKFGIGKQKERESYIDGNEG